VSFIFFFWPFSVYDLLNTHLEMIYTNESILTLVVKRIDKYFRELGEMADAVILPHGAPSLKDSRKAYGIFSRENLATEPLPSDVSARAQHLLRNNRFIDTYDDDVRTLFLFFSFAIPHP
jgi:hypothetical protein